MNRRAFVCGGMSVALLTTLAAEAEPAVKVYVIGILANNPWPAIDALRQGLESLGYREGRHLRYEYRWAGEDERFPGLASDLARLKVDTIVTWGTPAALAAKNATATIPIVMVLGDPVRVGIVSNLARPGGNVTGFTTLALELEAKRLEFLKELIPNAVRIAMLWNSANQALYQSLAYAQSAAVKLAVKLEPVEAHDVSGLERALEAIRRQRPDALLVAADPFLIGHRRRITEFAAVNRLPSVSNFREYAEVGGLMSYGPSYPDLFGRAAGYVDKILKGTKPGDLPFEEPSKFEVFVNLKTAKALGLTIPPALLLRADQVIE